MLITLRRHIRHCCFAAAFDAYCHTPPYERLFFAVTPRLPAAAASRYYLLRRYAAPPRRFLRLMPTPPRHIDDIGAAYAARRARKRCRARRCAFALGKAR